MFFLYSFYVIYRFTLHSGLEVESFDYLGFKIKIRNNYHKEIRRKSKRDGISRCVKRSDCARFRLRPIISYTCETSKEDCNLLNVSRTNIAPTHFRSKENTGEYGIISNCDFKVLLGEKYRYRKREVVRDACGDRVTEQRTTGDQKDHWTGRRKDGWTTGRADEKTGGPTESEFGRKES